MAAHTGFVSPIGVAQRSAPRPLRQQCRRQRLQAFVRARRQTARFNCAYGAGAKGGALVDSDGEKRLHVVLVHPQIHWNTGNMGRTCLGLGAVLHLVGPLGFSLDAKQVRRAGLDYWHHVEVYVYESWEQFANGAMQRIGGHRFFFTKFGQQSMAQLVWPRHGKIVMMFGSEVDGFDGIRWWLDGEGRDERTIAFPMVDERFRSFNLSTSASMALWDAYKFTTMNV